MRGRPAILLALGLAFAALASCGTKGDPVPPPAADEQQVDRSAAVGAAG